jgi:hypothetical protein
MKKTTLLSAFLGLVVGVTAYAGPFKSIQEVVIVEPDCLFRDTEFQIDAFGTGAFAKGRTPGWGGGLGANFFFLRYLGVGVEQSMFGHKGAKTDWATIGNFFLRYPICSLNLAPYAMVGIGKIYAQDMNGIGLGHVGGGLEYRFTNNIGLFTDARWMYSPDEPKSGVLARTGLRFAF